MLIKQTPGIRDAFDIDSDDVPDYSTVCEWSQNFATEVWRLLFRHSAEIVVSLDV